MSAATKRIEENFIETQRLASRIFVVANRQSSRAKSQIKKLAGEIYELVSKLPRKQAKELTYTARCIYAAAMEKNSKIKICELSAHIYLVAQQSLIKKNKFKPRKKATKKKKVRKSS